MTLVYDARLREFACWYEGQPVATQCEASEKGVRPHAAPVYDEIHFYRGQAVYLQFRNAMLNDLFSLALGVGQLEVPGPAIQGANIDLPNVPDFAAPALKLGAGPKAAPAPKALVEGTGGGRLPTEKLDCTKVASGTTWLYQCIDMSENALEEVEKALESLEKDLGTDEFGPVLFWNSDQRIERTKALVQPLEAEAQQLERELAKQVAIWSGLQRLEDYAAAIKELELLFRRQQGLHARVFATGLADEANRLVDQYEALLDPKISEPAARVLRNAWLDEVLSGLDVAFGEDSLTASEQIKRLVLGKDSDAYVFPAGEEPAGILARINESKRLSGTKPTAATLARLKTNLLTLLTGRGSLLRLRMLRKNFKALQDFQQAQPDLLSAFQARLNRIADLAVRNSLAAYNAGSSVPLPSPYDAVRVGTWYSNKQVTITIKQGTRLPTFSLGVLVAGPGDEGDKKAPGDPAEAPKTEAAARTLKVNIRDVYRWQVGGGIVVSFLKSTEYTSTTGKDASGNDQQVIAPSQASDVRVLPTANLIWYPFGRDFHPKTERFPGDKPLEGGLHNLGLLIGLSLNDPSKNVFAGATYSLSSGIGLSVGGHGGLVQQIERSTSSGVSFFAVRQGWQWNVFVGVTLEAQVFKSIFGLLF